jgi:hypothetical protein
VIKETCFIGTPITVGVFGNTSVGMVPLCPIPQVVLVEVARKQQKLCRMPQTSKRRQEKLGDALCAGWRCAERTEGKSLVDDDLGVLAVCLVLVFLATKSIAAVWGRGSASSKGHSARQRR